MHLRYILMYIPYSVLVEGLIANHDLGCTVSVKVDVAELTTCEVIESGRTLRLDAKDHSGTPVSVNVSFEQAEAILMTLPQLLRKALHERTGSTGFRFVFPLGRWAVEQALGHECLIVTLKTDDGFDVSFGVPLDVSRALAEALEQGATAAENRVDGGASELRAYGIPLN